MEVKKSSTCISNEKKEMPSEQGNAIRTYDTNEEGFKYVRMIIAHCIPSCRFPFLGIQMRW